MPKELDFENLRFCLDNRVADSIFIRLKGSSGGTVKVSEKLKKKKFDFNVNLEGLYFLIDSKEVFDCQLKNYDKGFAIDYERFAPGIRGVPICVNNPDDPYDPKLPEPTYSVFRNVLDSHLIEIAFNGRIDLKFHSWWHEPHWKYWTIDKEKMLKNKQ